ncbi:expressed unknown protein [Seminavis robusta]|uniref:Uncharacterized protein n=1 Tax=Seminavis robusta TaxID=568900 RepID=A0A9N8EGW8_9STRA|nr:expressed unknown protein [Seminavis robusta]|eukprot:Sro976_g226940.1 n/a (1124) ;mRNA; f:18335-21706
MALVGSMATTMEMERTVPSPMHRRSSNTADDEVHQRASLVLQMADSLITSNNRRRRQLEQIESGKIDRIQQVIDDIMLEKPASVMDLLREAEPEALPSREELKERYSIKKNKNKKKNDEGENGTETSKDRDEDDDDGGNKTEDDSDSSDDDEDNDDEDSVQNRDEFRMTQDRIVAEFQAAPPIDSDIDPEMLQAHTAPLQEQLKRSYAAIVKLRENSDLRYEALEKKYIELKRAQNGVDGTATTTSESEGAATAKTETTATPNDELARAYEAIVRLRENSDLRYNVLESKYLDLKRSHAESDAKNERLELEIETMRVQLLRVMNENNNKSSTTTNKDGAINEEMKQDIQNNSSLSQILFAPSSSRRASSPALLASGAALSQPANGRRRSTGGKPLMTPEQQKSLLQERNAHKKEHAAYRKKVQLEKKQVRNLRLTVLKEFVSLCDKVEGCSRCEEHISQLALFSVKDQIEKVQAEKVKENEEAMLEDSFREEEEDYADSEPDEDEEDDDGESLELDEDDESREVEELSESVKRHEGAMALLGASWDKLNAIDETKLDKPGGRFANLSESKTEQKLRGKQSQFVAAQSGVYCRIDHDMQQQYGDLDKFDAPARPPPPPPSPGAARIRHVPPKLSPYQPPPTAPRQRRATSFIPPPPLVTKYSDDTLDDSSSAQSSQILRNSPVPPFKDKVGATAPVKSALKNPLDVYPSNDVIPSKQVLNGLDRVPQDSPTSIVLVQDFLVDDSVTTADKTGLPEMSQGLVDVDDVDVDAVDVDVDAVDVDEVDDEGSPERFTSKLASASVDKPPRHASTGAAASLGRSSTVQFPLAVPEGKTASFQVAPVKPEPVAASPRVPRQSFASLDDSSRHSVTSLGSSKSPKPALRSKKAGNRKPMRKTVSFSHIVDHAPARIADHPDSDEEQEQKTENKPSAIVEEKPKQLKAPAAPGEGTDMDAGGESKSAKDDEEPSTEKPPARGSISRAGSKRIPPAKLDAAERKAKRELVLKEAKLAAKNVRKQNRSSRKLKVDSEDISLSSSASTLTADSAKPQKSFFKNPFKRKSKSFDAATARAAGIPSEIKNDDKTAAKAPVSPRTAAKQSTASELRRASSARLPKDKGKKVPASAVEC